MKVEIIASHGILVSYYIELNVSLVFQSNYSSPQLRLDLIRHMYAVQLRKGQLVEILVPCQKLSGKC